MAKIGVIYHSGYGHTAVVAQSVLHGVGSVDDVKGQILTVAEASEDLDKLDAFDAMIFGCPTYMGSASAEMKKFMELTSKKWYVSAWRNKLAAGFTNSGTLSGDKLSTLTELAVFAAQHGMLWVSLGVNAQTTPSGNGAQPNAINRLGSYLGLMTQADQAAPEQAMAEGDLKTAEFLGRRVAELALRWKNSE